MITVRHSPAKIQIGCGPMKNRAVFPLSISLGVRRTSSRIHYSNP